MAKDKRGNGAVVNCGLSGKEIAESLDMPFATEGFRRRNIRRELGITDTHATQARAYR